MTQQIADAPPWSDEITDYDRNHLNVYLRLLDAKADGAGLDDMARLILEIDPRREPERARASVESHLRRAEWMSERGYLKLLP